MTVDEDARATWELLTAPERRVLAAVAQLSTPKGIADVTGLTWQGAAKHARQLRAIGLVRIRSLPKQVSYELSSQGARCLEIGRTAGPWLASERPILANTGWRCPVFRRAGDGGHADPFTCGDTHVTADLAHQCAQREADRRNWPLDPSQASH